MLDIKVIRENPELIKKALSRKEMEPDVDRILLLDLRHRELIGRVESLKHLRRAASREIGTLKRSGGKVDEKLAEMKKVSDEVATLDQEIRELSRDLRELLIRVPNLPHDSVPVGPDERSNQIVRSWGEAREFDFTPRSHVEIAEHLHLIDFQRAAAVTGSHFVIYRGKGALLERALINFMLDVHVDEHGYLEISPPYLSNRESMLGTGQLPLLEEDMYRTTEDDLFLIPTGEVPITNIHRGEILKAEQLPIKYVGYTPCFRREAGSYGRETRGLIRIHQFDKVELVKLVEPSSSYPEQELLLSDAEDILQRLNLPYRVISLATGELSFASARCFDIEVWAPGQGEWLEVSSVSNFENFQARRADIRYRDGKGKIHFVHTLNGSGVALPRTVVALLENYQQADGSVVIPEVLRPYMRGMNRLAEP